MNLNILLLCAIWGDFGSPISFLAQIFHATWLKLVKTGCHGER